MIGSSPCTLDWGFKKIPFTLYTYVLAKILQNGAKFRYRKAGFKNYRNLSNFRQTVENPKSWNLMGFCPKKYISSAKTWYTVDLSNITFNYLGIHQITYVIFETVSYFPQHSSSVSFELKHYILSTKYPIKVQVFRLSTAQAKVHQIPLVIFQIKNQFFFKVWIFFQSHDT